jgi:hypothetical protein
MNTKKATELETISFRGDKDKWIDFQYAAKKEGHKNIWAVLAPMIDRYVKTHGNGKVTK